MRAPGEPKDLMPIDLSRRTVTIHYRSRCFQASWRRCFVVTLSALCMAYLAHWQWLRSLEKAHIVAQRHAHWHKPATQWSLHTPLTPYQHINMRGRFAFNQAILLDNKMQDHRVGYHVIMPFHLVASQQVVLINLGWIPRQKKPWPTNHLPLPHKIYTVQGHLYPLPTKVFSLSSVTTQPFKHYTLYQNLHRSHLKKNLGEHLLDYQLLLNETSQLGFIKSWHPHHLTPQRHVAYMIQFASLGLLMLIIFIASHTRKVKYRDKK